MIAAIAWQPSGPGQLWWTDGETVAASISYLPPERWCASIWIPHPGQEDGAAPLVLARTCRSIEAADRWVRANIGEFVVDAPSGVSWAPEADAAIEAFLRAHGLLPDDVTPRPVPAPDETDDWFSQYQRRLARVPRRMA